MLPPTPVSLLKAVGLLGLISTTSATSGYNCKPGQSCWPSNEQWEDLNRSLSGNLHRTIPFAASCYYDSPYYDPSTCEIVKDGNYLNQPRTDHLSDQCSRGRLSPLYVDAHEPKHVATAVKFAQAHKLRVSIKNTGHDYFGRSTSPNTLAIWTHNMNTTKYHESFTASNCPAANGQHIGEIGAGAQASGVYTYFQKFNKDVTGGNEGSVGLAGGFGQGGGHGVFGPSHGLMVDNAVEFDVVTADGKFRTINQCNDPELFWAMRGGGGGAFAILTSYRFQLHPAVKINVYSFKAEFAAQGKKNTTGTNYHALQEILTQHATYQPVWSRNNISGHAYYWPSKTEIYLVLPSNNVTALKALSKDFSSFVTSHPDIHVSESNYTTYPTYTSFLKLTSSIAARLTPAGIFEAVASRLIPESLFESPTNVSDLVNGFLDGVHLSNKLVPDGGALAQVIMTTPVNVQNGNTTSVNPAWRDALWHTIMTGGWPSKLAQEKEAKLLEAWLGTVQPLKELTPGGGAYVNEASYLEPEWEKTFFGENYPALLKVKNKYDPGHFFDCWKCVGWEGPSDEYSCYE